MRHTPAKSDYHDPFGPNPGSNRELYCIHCQRFMWEAEVTWRPDPTPGIDGVWGGKHLDCDGMGVGVDLWPVAEHPEIDMLPRNDGECSPMYPEEASCFDLLPDPQPQDSEITPVPLSATAAPPVRAVP